jgi:hypothetical protein
MGLGTHDPAAEQVKTESPVTVPSACVTTVSAAATPDPLALAEKIPGAAGVTVKLPVTGATLKVAGIALSCVGEVYKPEAGC